MTDLRQGVTPAQHEILDKADAIKDARGTLRGLYELQSSRQAARHALAASGDIRRSAADRRDCIIHAAAILTSLADWLDAESLPAQGPAQGDGA